MTFSSAQLAGWRAQTQRFVRIWAALLPIWAIATLVVGPVTLFALPKQLPTGAHLSNPLAVTFENDIALRGYKARVIEPRSPVG